MSEPTTQATITPILAPLDMLPLALRSEGSLRREGGGSEVARR